MKFRTSFLLSVHLMALASFQALIQTHELPQIFSIFIVGMISTSFLINFKFKDFHFPRPATNAIILSASFLFLMDWIYWSKSLLMASTHFLNLLLIIKLFTLKRSKDYIQLFLVCFLQILAASALSLNISFAFSLLLYLMMATWGMILYQMKAEIEERNRLYGFQEGRYLPETFESEEVVTIPLFLTTLGVGIFSFAFTLLIFFLIPRMGSGFLQKKEGEEIRTSGFSEKADFGSMAPIKLDPTVVMRVYMSAAPLKVYIKGTSFNVYDGKAWENTLHFQKTLPVGEEIPYTNTIISSSNISQEYIIEPMDTLALFVLARPVRLDAPFRFYHQDGMENLALQNNTGYRLVYKVSSFVPTLSAKDQQLKVAQLPPQRGSQTYLEYSFPDRERLIQLAQAATEKSSTVLEKANAIQQYLKKNFTYSLSVTPSKDHSAMEDFLFSQKKGYCEHFATAMVLMLRSLGIPSRLVTGYSPEEWNPYGNYFKVRQSDAHAWVEVYFPNSGWITFDPTPEGGRKPPESSFSAQLKQALLPLDQFLDAMKLKWDRYIVHYSIRDQLEVASTIQKKGLLTGELLKEKINEFMDHFPQYWKKGAPFVLIFLGLFLFLWGVMKISPLLARGFVRKPDPGETVTFYLGLLQVLSRYQLHKRPYQTPYEFLGESAETLRRIGIPFYAGAEKLTDLYYRCRFGGESLSEEEKRRTEEVLKSLREFLLPPRFS